MKKFNSFINEEVMPTALLHDSSIDIEKDAVRQEINGILAHCTMAPCVTPYVALRRISKALAYFHIFLPKRAYFEGDRGVEVYEIKQFGDRMGFTDKGEWITHVPSKFHLVFRYRLMGASFFVTAKIVDSEGLDKELDHAEAMVAESKKVKVPWKEDERMPTRSVKVGGDMRKRVRKLAQNAMKRMARKKPVNEGVADYIRGKVADMAGATPFGQAAKALGTSSAQAKSPDTRIMGNPDTAKKPTTKDGGSESPFPANEECGCSTDMETASERRAPKEKLKDLPTKKRGKLEEVSLSAKSARAGKDIGKPGKNFAKIANKAGAKYGSKEAGERVAGAVLAKMRAHHKEEYQIDELSYDTVARYHRKAADRYQTGEESYEKRKKGREMATRKRAGGMMGIPKAKVMAKEETISEKAPPGAKYERMVKHIKAGYAKDGLTKKEKGIAFATAWKAKNREKNK